MRSFCALKSIIHSFTLSGNSARSCLPVARPLPALAVASSSFAIEEVGRRPPSVVVVAFVAHPPRSVVVGRKGKGRRRARMVLSTATSRDRSNRTSSFRTSQRGTSVNRRMINRCRTSGRHPRPRDDGGVLRRGRRRRQRHGMHSLCLSKKKRRFFLSFVRLLFVRLSSKREGGGSKEMTSKKDIYLACRFRLHS